MKEKTSDDFWEKIKKDTEETRKKSVLQYGLPEDASLKDITDAILKGKSETAVKKESDQKEVIQNLEKTEAGEFNLQETLDRIKKDRSYMKTMSDSEWDNLKAAVADELKIDVKEIDTMGLSNLDSSHFGVMLKNGKELSANMGTGTVEKPNDTVNKELGEAILKKIDDIYQKDGFEQAVLYIKKAVTSSVKLPNDQLAKRLKEYSGEAMDNNSHDIAILALNLAKELEYKEYTNS